VSEASGAIARDLIREGVAASLPEFMVPASFTVIDALPLTPNGKIDRARLPAPSQGIVSTDYVSPRGAFEAKIATIWQETLGLPGGSRTANFFGLGGDSLLAVAMHRRLCDAIEQDILISDIFDTPTLADLAERIRPGQQPAEAWSPIVPIAPDGS